MGTNKGKTRRVPIADSQTSENELDTDDLRSVIISLIDQNGELVRKCAIMDTDKGDTKRVPRPDFWISEYESDPDDLRSVVIRLIDQNAELGRKLEEQNSVIKLSEDTIIELNKQAECIVSDIVVSVLQKRAKLEGDRIEAEAKQGKEDARQEGINAAAEEGQVILQSAIDRPEIIKAQAEVEAKRIIDKARNDTEYSLRSSSVLFLQNTVSFILYKLPRFFAAALPCKQKDEKQEYHSKSRRGEKGIVRLCWYVEIQRQQHQIEILLNTFHGLFLTGGGRLLVDGETMHNWGWNPFTFIPNTRLEVKVANMRAFISPKGTTTKYPVLVLGNQEIPPIPIKSPFA